MRKPTVTILTVSLVFNLVLSILLLNAHLEYSRTIELLSLKIRTLKEENENLRTIIFNLSQNYQRLVEENARLKEMVNTLLRQLPAYSTPEHGIELRDYDWIPIFGVYAVTRDMFSYELKGIMMKAYLKLSLGRNRIFIATTPKIGIELQASAEKALKAALKVCGSREIYDVYIVIKAEREVQVVDGPSAGAAIAVMITALLKGDSIRKDVGLTGTIDENGNIGPVGGILEKAIVAAENGIRVFLVPKGQSKIIKYVPVKKKVGILEWIYYKPMWVDLEEELRKRGFFMKVVEVSTLSEAYLYFIQE